MVDPAGRYGAQRRCDRCGRTFALSAHSPGWVATTKPRPAWVCPQCCRETGCSRATRCRTDKAGVGQNAASAAALRSRVGMRAAARCVHEHASPGRRIAAGHRGDAVRARPVQQSPMAQRPARGPRAEPQTGRSSLGAAPLKGDGSLRSRPEPARRSPEPHRASPSHTEPGGLLARERPTGSVVRARPPRCPRGARQGRPLNAARLLGGPTGVRCGHPAVNGWRPTGGSTMRSRAVIAAAIGAAILVAADLPAA
jgi:hypothetical protein